MYDATREQSGKKGLEGILDPFATGLLIVGVGHCTRFLSYAHQLKKTYIATLTLGVSTDSYDSDGAVTETSQVPEISIERVKQSLQKFVGKGNQTPPKWSNIRVDGKRARERAKLKQNFTMPTKEIEIFAIELLEYQDKQITFKVTVSAGSYIRSLAVDIAQTLDAIGHLTALRRTAIGEFTLADKFSDSIQAIKIISAEEFLYWLPSLELSLEQSQSLLQGKLVDITDVEMPTSLGSCTLHGAHQPGTSCALKLFSNQKFLGLGNLKSGVLRSTRLLPT